MGTTIISEHSQVTSDPDRHQSPLPTRSRHALVSTTTEVIYLESQSQVDIPVPTEVVDLTQDSDDEAGVQACALQPGKNTHPGIEDFIVDDMVPGHRRMLRLIDQARSVNDFILQDKDWVLRRSTDAPMFRSDINHYDALVGMARFTNAVHAQHQKADTELGGACGRVVQKLCDLQFGPGALQDYLDKHGSDRFIGHCRRSCKATNNPFRSVRFKEFMNQLGQLSNLANHKRKRILLVIMGVDGSFIDLIYWHKLRHVLSETHHIDVCFYFDKHAGFSPIMPLASLLEYPFGEPLTAYFFTRLVKLADARRRPHGPEWRDEYRDGDKERNSLANVAQAT
ncbi:hypothetical protein B9Z65_2647 [Elsinoe australis]|uniref:Uncharacterized protein n=1 Tax=Elsinoe australis TaxID=40998 RepID=A0A2P8A495_9PEZI|nr:hypothetical protein B9Z65_2647 [Elsinoe australis]